ncbi:hypothetical protein SESBI_21395 [Sesbania bispinosa]|nr:hypothetical protein SESBI_21395 [Sesbania bispinosa]
MQSQACQQLIDEAEKEYGKVSERITESQEAMKASYEEFIANAQAIAHLMHAKPLLLSFRSHLRRLFTPLEIIFCRISMLQWLLLS